PALSSTQGPSISEETVTCSGLSPSVVQNLWFGIRNDSNVNGETMTGSAPTTGSTAVYKFAGVISSNSISYAGNSGGTATTVFDAVLGTRNVKTGLTLEFQSGTGALVSTGGGDPESNDNGDITQLWRLNSNVTSFTIKVNVNAAISPTNPTDNSIPTVF